MEPSNTKGCCPKCRGREKSPSGLNILDVCYDDECECHKEKCCERCTLPNNPGIMVCINCPCHRPKTEKDNSRSACPDTGKPHANCLICHAPTQNNGEWEERFHTEFPYDEHGDLAIFDEGKIKAFIASTRKEAEEAERARILAALDRMYQVGGPPKSRLKRNALIGEVKKMVALLSSKLI